MATKYLFAAMKAKTDDPVAKLILIYLADAANEQGYCWPSYPAVAEGCECSLSTAKRKVAELVDAGFITYQQRTQRGFKTSNKYKIIDPDLIKNGKPEGGNTSVQPDTTSVQPDPTVGSQRAVEPINTLSMNKLPTGFNPPSVQEVRDYCPDIDAERFCDFYESKGWMVGKNKMKSWQAAVRNWRKGEDHRPTLRRERTNGERSTRDMSIIECLTDTSWADDLRELPKPGGSGFSPVGT